jgi:hypothetical protein
MPENGVTVSVLVEDWHVKRVLKENITARGKALLDLVE